MKYTGKYKKMAEQFQKDGCDADMIEKFILQEREEDEFRKGERTTDIGAYSLWKSYSDEIKEMWLHNAFCFQCGNASFKPGYNLRKDKFGIRIEGFCNKCGGKIVRCCD